MSTLETNSAEQVSFQQALNSHPLRQIRDQSLVPSQTRLLPFFFHPRIPKLMLGCPVVLDAVVTCTTDKEVKMPTRKIVPQHDSDHWPNSITLLHFCHGLDTVQFRLNHVRQDGRRFEIVFEFILALALGNRVTNVGPKTLDIVSVSTNDPLLRVGCTVDLKRDRVVWVIWE